MSCFVMTTNKKYVIIDTDCGVDDAIAIMLATYAQKKGLIDILAITCTHGNTSVDNVVKNVCLTLRASDSQTIKVYKGCEGPIIGSHDQTFEDPNYDADGLGGVANSLPKIDPKIESGHAAEALIKLARDHPKQIDLIALGPLSNIALAYQLDNKFFDNLQQIVFMGGTSEYVGNVEPTVEFNVSADPEACHMMLTNAKCPLTFVSWECGMSNLLTWDIWDKIIKTNSVKADFIHKIMSHDYKRITTHSPSRKGFVLCDILAVVALVYPNLVQSTQTYPTSIELAGTLTRGQLVSDKRIDVEGYTIKKIKAPMVKFVNRFDQKKLMDLLLDLVK